MLRSMVDSLLPTRAEATDVANAVLDGTDAVMLSEETAIGRYPVESVRMMERILAQAEPLLAPRTGPVDGEVADVIAHTACDLAARLDARAIVVPTRSGSTARRVASHRPRVPIVALTLDEAIRRRLSLVWGVTALTFPWADRGGLGALEHFREPLRGLGLVPPGGRVVVTAGWPGAQPGTTNLVHVASV
jgi:pyruvate kinase